MKFKKNYFILGQSHSSVERAGLLGGVKLRSLSVDDDYKLRGETLERAIKEDRENGLIPFYVNIKKKKNQIKVNLIKFSKICRP